MAMASRRLLVDKDGPCGAAMPGFDLHKDQPCPSGGEVTSADIPSWITPELIALTIKVWQPYYASPLSSDDAVTMILGVGRLFGVLSRS
jgi:hypothetical protein